MAINFIQYPLMISLENVNLDKTILQKIKRSTIRIDQDIEIHRTRFLELCLKLV